MAVRDARAQEPQGGFVGALQQPCRLEHGRFGEARRQRGGELRVLRRTPQVGVDQDDLLPGDGQGLHEGAAQRGLALAGVERGDGQRLAGPGRMCGLEPDAHPLERLDEPGVLLAAQGGPSAQAHARHLAEDGHAGAAGHDVGELGAGGECPREQRRGQACERGQDQPAEQDGRPRRA